MRDRSDGDNVTPLTLPRNIESAPISHQLLFQEILADTKATATNQSLLLDQEVLLHRPRDAAYSSKKW